MSTRNGVCALAALCLLFAGPIAADQPETERSGMPIRLKARTFTPRRGSGPEVGQYFRQIRQERAHVLLQFDEVPTLAERDVLRRDKVELLDPIPERAFFASLPAQAELPQRLLNLPRRVRWIGVIESDDKLAPSLKGGVPAHARRPPSSAEVIVLFFGDVPVGQQQRLLRSVGATLLTRIVPLNGWRVIVKETVIPRLLAADPVKWIEEIPQPLENDNDGIRSATGVNADAVQPPALFNLTGAGVILAQWEDTHASTGHNDYSARITVADAPIPRFERSTVHSESVAANGLYDNGEGVYVDFDDSGTVNANDVRLTAVGAFAAGSTVAAADADVTSALVAFSLNERFADTVTADFMYTAGESIYADVDSSSNVSIGDVRRTPVGAFAAGSVVAAADADIGTVLRQFSFIPHYHATHVAGTLIGAGTQSAANGGTANQWKGVAPGATLRSYSGNPTSAGVPAGTDEYADAATAGAAISSNSWGTTHCHQILPPSTCYDVGTQYYDAVISGRRSDGTPSGLARQLLVFGSSGNRGYPERHSESVAVNGQYDNGEGIYRDLDDNGVVSAGDQRRTPVGAFAANTLVAAADADAAAALVNFNMNERHDDTVSVNFSGSLTFDNGEGIYIDADASRTVSAGDTRITPVGAFAAGSIVAAADADAGRNIRNFNLWGNVRVPNSAKDTVEVASVSSDAAALQVSSSRGPTDDGRIKPDIAAPGCQNGGDGGIKSTWPGNLYNVICGTSMATPAAAATDALVEEWYRTACLSAGASPSTLRGLLLHSAEDLTNIPAVGTTYAGPDFAFGYGRARVKEAVELVPHHRQGSAAAVGDTDITVTTGTGGLKVTLVWDDPPFTANAAPSPATGILQNDLDLVLIAPDGTKYTPWETSGANPFATASRTITPAAGLIPASARDRRNTLEQVVVDNAAAGTWTIRVTASTLNLPPQNYTIITEALPVQSGPCASTPAGDVWLMDTPADTGAVPSSGNQWEGPDPWNRQTADGMPTHQNPEFGQTNALYATLRNTMAATVRATSVDFWIAAASVGLIWPDNFRFVGRLSAPNMTPGEVRQIGPLLWSPPAPVPLPHHCMYVRVQSPQDPITFAEVPSIWTNSMSSNNIVYRNMDIYDLFSSRSAGVFLRNIRKEAADVDLIIETPEEFLKNGGEVLVSLPPALEKVWRSENRKTQGLVPPDPRYRSSVAPMDASVERKEPQEPQPEQVQPAPYRIAAPRVALRGFRMGPRQAEPIRITFSSPSKTKAEYPIRFIGQVGGETFGGFTFVIRTGQQKEK
jgi:subtilase family protein